MASQESDIPYLKWAGGKRWQVPFVKPLYRDGRFVEPFCGGIAMAMGIGPTRALLNDINPHLVNFYVQVQNGLTITTRMVNDSDCYYQSRDRFNALIDSGDYLTSEAAGLFYYLNRTGYNGLCRFNRRGRYNVPFGRHKTIAYRSSFFLDGAGGWEFSCDDFENIDLSDTDFVYADPPYDVPFTSYSPGGFSWDDQQRVAVWLARHEGPCVLVNQATDRVDDLYRSLGYDVSYVTAPRRISCTGGRDPVVEIIASRNLGAQRTRDLHESLMPKRVV